MLSAVEKKSDQVYRWLLAYIDENKFSGNQRLPSENALCRKLGVSRETIRVAIDRLVNEGIVYKVKGSGTYFHREKVMTRDLNTEDALYKRCLPASVRTDNSEEVPFVDGKVDVMENIAAVVSGG